MPIIGDLTVEGRLFFSNQPSLPVFPARTEAQSITLQAGQGGAKAVLFSGQPLDQPVFWQGPFAMASAEALETAMAAYQKGEFGSLHST